MANPWLAAFRLTQLGFEAQSVIALRLMKLAMGGPAAKKEAKRMVSEKVAALAEAQIDFARSIAFGNAEHAPAKIIANYSRRVRANRRRLSGQ